MTDIEGLLKRLDEVVQEPPIADGFVTELAVALIGEDYKMAATAILKLQAKRDAAWNKAIEAIYCAMISQAQSAVKE